MKSSFNFASEFFCRIFLNLFFGVFLFVRIFILFSGSREEESFLIRDLVQENVLITSFKREYNNLESVFFHLTEPEI